MNDPIELAIESPDGIVDCRLERIDPADAFVYSATILYPHLINGRVISKVYEHNLNLNAKTGLYYFAEQAMVHPKVLLLEDQLSAALNNNK
jgi:hypothetical protein